MKGLIVGGIRIKPYLPKSATPQVNDAAAIAKINGAATLSELQTAWQSLTTAEQKLPTVIAAKDNRKINLK
jgi:hypothetical protein